MGVVMCVGERALRSLRHREREKCHQPQRPSSTAPLRSINFNQSDTLLWSCSIIYLGKPSPLMVHNAGPPPPGGSHSVFVLVIQFLSS